MAVTRTCTQLRNVILVCTLGVGDKVSVDKIFGRPIGGRTGTVIEIKPYINCESGFIVRIDIYDSPLDSNWLTKIKS